MSEIIEIEMRGPVPEDKVGILKERLKKEALFVELKNRVLIDYTTFLDGETIEDRTTDIRIRNTNGTSEIIVKTGKWGGSDVRDEFKVQTLDTFDSLVRIMDLLGYKKGVLCVRNSEVYQLGDVEIALVEVPGHSYYFEAEIETNEGKEHELLKSKILTTVSSLGLELFSDEEFYAYIKELNINANTLFDSAKAPKEYFKENFHI